MLISSFCFSQPYKQKIDNDVKYLYHLYSKAIGSSSYNIKKIIIDKIEKTQNDTFLVYIIVTGKEKNFTIAKDKWKKFKNKFVFKYYLNIHKEWEYTTENDPRDRFKN
ncbi:MAG: hypothetical protein HUU47_01665 [Bacteroidetes bacterium]|nr:hypothetical protein [Bacteroidota bacterium]